MQGKEPWHWKKKRMEHALVSVNIEHNTITSNVVSPERFSQGPATSNNAKASTFAEKCALQTQQTGDLRTLNLIISIA